MLPSYGLATAFVAGLALSARASPISERTAQPWATRQAALCAVDSDCTSSQYCGQDASQGPSSGVAGVCLTKGAIGDTCFKNSACSRGGCVDGQCSYSARSAAQIRCTKRTTGYLGAFSLDEYRAESVEPSQPYLTFGGHEARLADGSLREVLTTSGAAQRVAFEYWECPSAAMGYARSGAGQLRVPSKGQDLCLTGDVATVALPCADGATPEYGGCAKARRSTSGSAGIRGYAPLYLAPCRFGDDSRQISNQFWIDARSTEPPPDDESSIPFLLAGPGGLDEYVGVAIPNARSDFSTWVLDLDEASDSNSPLFLIASDGY